VPVVTVTADYTIVPSTDFVILCNASGKGTVTVTLPTVASNVGRMFVIKQVNALSGSSDHCRITPVGTTSGTTTVILDAPDATSTNINSGFWVVSDGTKWWAIAATP